MPAMFRAFCATRGFAALGLTLSGVFLGVVAPANAATLNGTTIAEFTAGTGVDRVSDLCPAPCLLFLGQAVTTPNHPVGWGNIAFNWFDAPLPALPFQPPVRPIAFGQLFILNQKYEGTPEALDASVAGFLAQSTGIARGQYIFDPQFILKPSTTYFFYTNEGRPDLVGAPTVEGQGNFYFTRSPSAPFIPIDAYANFQLTGTPVPTPALLPGLVGLGVALLRKHRAEVEGGDDHGEDDPTSPL